MAKERSCFQSETDFCPECGTILPLPGLKDTVVCSRCSFSIDVHEFEGRPVISSVIFNKPGTFSMQEEEGELKGPVIDRKCTRCGHEGMVYHTRQMRSADEGQTVFYTCTNCRYQEKEDS